MENPPQVKLVTSRKIVLRIMKLLYCPRSTFVDPGKLHLDFEHGRPKPSNSTDSGLLALEERELILLQLCGLTLRVKRKGSMYNLELLSWGSIPSHPTTTHPRRIRDTSSLPRGSVKSSILIRSFSCQKSSAARISGKSLRQEQRGS